MFVKRVSTARDTLKTLYMGSALSGTAEQKRGNLYIWSLAWYKNVIVTSYRDIP